MKIEKLNDNQIRCILDKNDLDKRQLQLSELAYGSDKAKALFRDMMEQAAMEFDFETGDNIPLMIEAIPVSPECLILVVTKVEDPEELDTRFSRFAGGDSEEDFDMDEEELSFENTYSIDPDDEEIISFGDDSAESVEGEMDIMAPFNKAIARAKEEVLKKKKGSTQTRPLEDQIYVFDSLDSVISISGHLSGFYAGESILYKDSTDDSYYMMLLRQETDPDLYTRACNICSDHGDAIMASYATPAYFKEHFKLICPERAIQTLSQFN